MKSVMDEDFLDLPDDFNLTTFSEHIFADMETEFRNNFKDMDDSHSLVLVTFYSIFTLCGLLANTLFCVVVLRCKKLHNVTHMLMTNLACCNIVFLIFYPAYLMNTFIFSYSDWQFGTFMCKVCLSVIYISSTGPYIYYSEVVVQKTTVKCGCTMEPSRVYFGFMSMTMLTIVFQYIIPLLIIVPAYAHIAHFLYSRQPVGEQSREKQLKHIRRKRRLLGTLMAIVALLTAATNIDTFIYSTIITLLGVTGIPICFLNNDLFRKQLFCLLSCIIPDRLRTAIHTDRTDVPHNATALLHATDVEMDGDSRMATSIRSSRRGTPVDIALMPNLGASVQLKDQSSPRDVPTIKIEEP
ncbi:hypothetical protein PRIPAC_97188 [Pristionchus pacificus]|uniref:G protein-coupled receptor n=1 Tax=Pristionchus pacificus TaxID=54126 RepID=A0A2A6CGW4_PRIPA|nr:hypothetical protein PRIPAC_97188 [Pristionchus pacificus]|eukprot:PDM77464.1 G protein-coupled receptor [Pristionchus pacificus]